MSEFVDLPGYFPKELRRSINGTKVKRKNPPGAPKKVLDHRFSTRKIPPQNQKPIRLLNA
jgi:hypothetical protein